MPKGWKPINPDIEKASSVTNLKYGPETVIWRNDLTTGIISKKVIETQIITNLSIYLNNRSFSLISLDDILVMNQYRDSERMGYYGRGAGYSSGRGKTIGDVVFLYQGQPVIVFRQVVDPNGVCRLAKSARKRLLSIMKFAEKEQAKMQTEKERKMKEAQKIDAQQMKIKKPIMKTLNTKENEISQTYVIKPTDTTAGISCIKCGNVNPSDCNFCLICGIKLSYGCSKCGNVNPSGSTFCNKCGFALT